MTALPFDGILDQNSIFEAIRGKVKPEVLQACRVILHALLDEPEDLTARSKRWAKEAEEHIRRTKERIERAERGVKTRRKNQKKKVFGMRGERPVKARTNKPTKRVEVKERCMSFSPVDLGGHVHRCALASGHRRDHQKGELFWKRKPGEKRNGRAPQPKYKPGDLAFASARNLKKPVPIRLTHYTPMGSGRGWITAKNRPARPSPRSSARSPSWRSGSRRAESQ